MGLIILGDRDTFPKKYADSNGWKDSPSENLGEVVEKNNKTYQIIAVKSKTFSKSQKAGRRFLGVIIAIATLGLAVLFSSNVRELFHGSTTRRFAVEATLEPLTSIQDNVKKIKQALESIPAWEKLKQRDQDITKIQVVMWNQLKGKEDPIVLPYTVHSNNTNGLSKEDVQKTLLKCVDKCIKGFNFITSEERFKNLNIISDVWVEHSDASVSLLKNVFDADGNQIRWQKNAKVTPPQIQEVFKNYKHITNFIQS